MYSLGVMLLQIITARPPMGITHHVGRAGPRHPRRPPRSGRARLAPGRCTALRGDLDTVLRDLAEGPAGPCHGRAPGAQSAALARRGQYVVLQHHGHGRRLPRRRHEQLRLHEQRRHVDAVTPRKNQSTSTISSSYFPFENGNTRKLTPLNHRVQDGISDPFGRSQYSGNASQPSVPLRRSNYN